MNSSERLLLHHLGKMGYWSWCRPKVAGGGGDRKQRRDGGHMMTLTRASMSVGHDSASNAIRYCYDREGPLVNGENLRADGL